MSQIIETRTTQDKCTRALAIPDTFGLVGYASTWDSYDMGAFFERIEPSAFTNALAGGADVMALLNHDSSLPLARTKNNTLRLGVDDTGLRCEIDAVDTSYARDMCALVSAGVLSSMSFGFRCLKDIFEPRAGESPLRIIQELEIVEVSVVTFPANPATSIDTRSLALWQATQSPRRKAFYFIPPS